MSISSDFYYTYKRRLEEAQKKPISQIKERAWLLENLAKELLNDLASEWLSKEDYEKEIGIIGKEKETFQATINYEEEQHRILDERFAWAASFLCDEGEIDRTLEKDKIYPEVDYSNVNNSRY